MVPEITQAAVKVANEVGYRNVTRAKVCAELGQSLAWLQYRCPFKKLMAYLEDNAEALGLVPGETGDTTAKFSGAWAAHNRDKILSTAYGFACTLGFKNFSRNELARASGVSAGVVNLRWGSMAAVLDAVAEKAIAEKNTDLLRQAQAFGNEVAISYFKGLDGSVKLS
jgi:hypothetical protein